MFSAVLLNPSFQQLDTKTGTPLSAQRNYTLGHPRLDPAHIQQHTSFPQIYHHVRRRSPSFRAGLHRRPSVLHQPMWLPRQRGSPNVVQLGHQRKK